MCLCVLLIGYVANGFSVWLAVPFCLFFFVRSLHFYFYICLCVLLIGYVAIGFSVWLAVPFCLFFLDRSFHFFFDGFASGSRLELFFILFFFGRQFYFFPFFGALEILYACPRTF